MTKFVFSLKYEPFTEISYFKPLEKYNPKIHGRYVFLTDIPNNATRKEINWYHRNYYNVWSFMH